MAGCAATDVLANVGPSPAQISTAFIRLHWPSAQLTLQPPDHRTLVNLPTVFSTDLMTVQSQTVTLLGARVTIEATPVAYTWYAGDGGSWATDDAGAAYAAGDDVSTLNTHTYQRVARVRPSVAVTYHGRYRVDGGTWTDIGQELTVQGAGVPLRVLQAKADLTG